MTDVLAVQGLTVDYRRGRHRTRAVDGVDLTLVAGRTVALVGESGSGKSSVVRALARFVRPTAGTIRLDGTAAHRNRAYRHRLQVVFQDPFASLNPMHTVGHHLRRPLLVHGTDGPVDEAVAALLTSVNLVPAGDIAAKRPHELSGGQRQRVAIARALATNPAVLLADEPVSMLDVSIRLEILGLLDRLRTERNLAMLYVTHDLATARHFAADILVMYRGQIVERGPSDRVILAPRHPYTQLLARSAPRAPGTRPAAGPATTAVADRRAIVTSGDACVFAARCPHVMPVCARRPPDTPLADAGGTVRCWLADSPL